MADAWTVTHTADTSSYGWTTQVSYVPGLPPEGFSTSFSLVGQTKSTLGSISQLTDIYSEAKEVLQNGTVITALNNIDPIIFISVPPSRIDAWNTLTADSDFEGVYAKNASSDWGEGGWKALDIIRILAQNTNFIVPIEFSAFDYDIATWKVDPYGNVLNEFKRMFSGIPAVWIYENNNVTAKLPPFMTVNPTFEVRKSVSMRYNPQKKVSILVHGGWGKPVVDGGAVETIVHTPEFFEELPAVFWGDDIVALGIAKTTPVDVPTLMIGKLASNPAVSFKFKEKDIQFQSESDVDVGQGPMGTGALYDIESTRHEVLNTIGMSIATLTSRQKTKHYVVYDKSDTSGYAYQETHSYSVHEVFIVSYGDSVDELRSVSFVDKELKFQKIIRNGARILAPSAYQVTYHNYEDMLSSARSNITDATVSAAMGRKKAEVMYTFTAYIQSKDTFGADAGDRSCWPIQDVTEMSDDYLFAFYLTQIRTIHYDPLGNGGYRSTEVVQVINPQNRSSTIATSPGSGDASNFVSMQPFGPGYTKLRAIAGDGEIEGINIACCNRDQIQGYADKVYEYYKGNYQLSVTEEVPLCSSEPTSDFGVPDEKPGLLTSKGLLVSISKTIAPMKITYNRVYKYYDTGTGP